MQAWLFSALAGFALLSTASIAADRIYTGALPAADAAERRFTLTLRDDGTAALHTDYAGKGVVAELGRWSQDGARVVFHSSETSDAVIWRVDARSLLPVAWDRINWGTNGPPVLIRR